MADGKGRQELIAAVGRATQAYQRATDGFDDAVGRRLDLNPTDLRCLDWLTEGPMSAGELSRATGLSSAATTTLVDRLEGRGLVRRGRDQDDRRRVVVELTDDARQHLEALYGPLAREGGRLLARFDDEDLRLLIEFLDEATRVVEEHEARLRS
ncbi:MAG: MarR family winged helix-turn-helix transcriptional regulator [Actinomycetota bacterium]